MNYLWEVALRADDCGAAREEIRYRPAKIYSPYIEASFTDLNESDVGAQTVEANPLYRFAHIFAAIFDINITIAQQTRNALFDICMHYIIQIDLRQGLSKSEYQLRFLLRDLLDGVYQDKFAYGMQQLNHVEIRKILICMHWLLTCGGSILLFRQATRVLYPDAIVYESNDNFRELFIYLGKKDTAEERGKIDFITGVFLAKDYTVHLFWEHHFGIIDVDVTMELDEMVLF